jgi:hypothetical protein
MTHDSLAGRGVTRDHPLLKSPAPVAVPRDASR